MNIRMNFMDAGGGFLGLNIAAVEMVRDRGYGGWPPARDFTPAPVLTNPSIAV
jgi:hypothetical protein